MTTTTTDPDYLDSRASRHLALTYDNVTLVAVSEEEGGGVNLHLEHNGVFFFAAAAGEFAPQVQYLERNVGKIGRLQRPGTAAGATVNFQPYPDQSLRRAPQFDVYTSSEPTHRNNAVIGWTCVARGAFLAPRGLIPGVDGAFVPDNSILVTIPIPQEFVGECNGVGLSPEDVLRGFIADLAEISNFVHKNPRADGYNSNGSDERMMANEYFDRAYDHLREDAERLQEDRERAAELTENEEGAFDDMRWIADTYGIPAEDLLQLIKTRYGDESGSGPEWANDTPEQRVQRLSQWIASWTIPANPDGINDSEDTSNTNKDD